MTPQQIKFRGFRTDGKGWVEGDLAYMFNNPNNTCIMPSCYFTTRDFGEEDEKGNPILEDTMALGGFISVVPSSLGIFTGITDKNGKEIYGAIGERGGDMIRVAAKHGFNSELLNEFKELNKLDTLNGIGSHFTGIIRMDFLRGISFENMNNGYREPMFTRHIDIKRNHSNIEIIGNQWEQGNGK